METRMSYQGIMMEQYLQMIGKTMEDFKKENEEQAKTSVKTRLTLEAIVKAENIEASEEDVNAKIEEMAAMYGRPADELKVNKHVKFIGRKNNPYPYMLQADYLIITSDYEGFPVIYLEGITLNKNIITTINTSDDEINMEDYAYIVSKENIYKVSIAAMELSKQRKGALIVIERDISLNEYIILLYM